MAELLKGRIILFTLKEICGITGITPEVLKEDTDKFVNSVEQFVHQYQIRLKRPPAGSESMSMLKVFLSNLIKKNGFF